MEKVSVTLPPEYTRLFSFAQGDLAGWDRLFVEGFAVLPYSASAALNRSTPARPFYRIFPAPGKFTSLEKYYPTPNSSPPPSIIPLFPPTCRLWTNDKEKRTSLRLDRLTSGQAYYSTSLRVDKSTSG